MDKSENEDEMKSGARNYITLAAFERAIAGLAEAAQPVLNPANPPH